MWWAEVFRSGSLRGLYSQYMGENRGNEENRCKINIIVWIVLYTHVYNSVGKLKTVIEGRASV